MKAGTSGLARAAMPESAMPAYQDSAALFAPATPDTSESAMTTLYRAAIGPVNAERYLPRFARLDTLGRIRPGWNWAACVCTLNWMALRHLWSAALVYVAAVEGLALLAAHLLDLLPHAPAGLVVTGGQTAVALCRALGISSIAVTGEALPYAATGVVRDGPWAGLPLVTKGGLIGDESALTRCVSHILDRRGRF